MPFRTLTNTEEISILHKISAFEEELRRRLEIEVPLARRELDTTKGLSAVPNRVFDCQSYPIYQFVPTGLEMKPISGMRTISPGEDIEQVSLPSAKGSMSLRCFGASKGGLVRRDRLLHVDACKNLTNNLQKHKHMMHV